MPFDPFLAEKLYLLEGITWKDAESDPEAAARLARYFQDPAEWTMPEVTVEELSVDGPHGPIPVRTYRPRQTPTAALLWVHGGGFWAGDLDMPEAHTVSAELAARAGAFVASVGYRLAVNGVRYPVPLDDVEAAWRWLAEKAIADRLMLGGASAGAALALAAALRARDSHRDRDQGGDRDWDRDRDSDSGRVQGGDRDWDRDRDSDSGRVQGGDRDWDRDRDSDSGRVQGGDRDWDRDRDSDSGRVQGGDRDRGHRPADLLLLAYPFAHFPNPALDDAFAAEMAALPATLRFPVASIEAMVGNYVGRISDLPPDALPGAARLDGLPPTRILLSEYDDLRPSGELLERQLREAGVPVGSYTARGMPHGHLNRTPSLDGVDASLDFFAAAIRTGE
ncbi:alpha/beta hydrolase [Nonomuraea sp. NPDC046802]|uniref:alpha/beta hydrolase n=1 Tax=Nonomuraea sp. NPDC046802 TaxID=3154919 RepID=UPI0033D306A4